MTRQFRGGSGRAMRNERKYPYIVELRVRAGELDIALSRRIMEFHKARQIQPRHGRTMLKERRTYYRWCFFDLVVARAFAEEFGGELEEYENC
jgi:hypothetical protein